MGKNDRIVKEHPEYIVNLIDVFRKLDPSDTGKFLPFIMKQFNDKININSLSDAETDTIINAISPNGSRIEKYLLMILFHTLGKDNLYALWEFEKHLIANRVEQKDIQKYKNWDDIINATMMADLKVKEKELRKQIITLFDDDEWLVLKPLSYQSSLAYGANTKWCTASRHNESYFYDYTSRGVLVYVINRKTASKCAMFIDINPKALKKGIDITFWNAEDTKVESLSLDLPEHIMAVLRQQINDKTQMKPNRNFFGVDEIKKTSNNNRIIQPMNIPENLVNLEEAEEEVPMERMEAVREPVDAGEGDWDVPNELIERRRRPAEIHGEPNHNRPVVILGNMEETRQRIRNIAVEALHALNETMVDDAFENEQEERIEITNEAMLEVAEDMVNYDIEEKYPKSEELLVIPDFILGPHVQAIDAPKIFEPAPWLTQSEIDIVNKLIDDGDKQLLRAGCDVNHYAFPDGRIIEVYDEIKRNVVVNRIVWEVRNGRSEDTKFNPFSLICEPILQTSQTPEEDLDIYAAMDMAEQQYARVYVDDADPQINVGIDVGN